MTISLHTPVCDWLGCRYPIVQTAMGWVADANLVGATSNAGGFGFLACATIEPGRLEAEIQKVIRLTDAPFGLNFHMFQPNARQVIDLAIRYKVRAVSYGRGPDRQVIDQLRRAGVVCMPTVGHVKHAIKAVELGADIVTIQGAEGGGHTGATPTTILLPLLDAVDVPVVAAGGYACGRGLASALAAGAAGVAMGTRFLMTRESPVPAQTLARYLEVNDPGSIRVTSVVDGLPQRLIQNEALLRMERSGWMQRVLFSASSAMRWKRACGASVWQSLRALRAMALDARQNGGSLTQALMAANAPMLIQSAIVSGQPELGVLPSGQVAASIGELKRCADVIEEIAAQATQRLSQLIEHQQRDLHERCA
ncbi:2-nitropropane dioxygenase [Pandoraea vervacti]|uniref:2-nitropropane dioxygenase n=1 Tax=Pandoraea vervacti TaxID=656178 RepID=A0ABN4FMM8_9BURK|nr:nitronate monooxygenase [Pandoraea vervacti]AJP56798.1 2-nitropropane dioxygenase [Pandoraea vervacti]